VTPVNFTFFDLPFLANANGDFTVEINEDWESYQIGDAGTQTLDGGFGYTGTWTAVGTWYGVRGTESWNGYAQVVYGGDSGSSTELLGGGDSIWSGTWYVQPQHYSITANDGWYDYSYGTTGTMVLNSGTGFSGTWV
jgi:hypothetical protein